MCIKKPFFSITTIQSTQSEYVYTVYSLPVYYSS